MWQGSPYYPSHADLHMSPTSSDLRHGGSYHGGSYHGVLSSSSSADASLPLPLDVPGGGMWQRPPHYPSHVDLHIPSTSSDPRSPHPVYSPASTPPQYHSPSLPAYPTGPSPSRWAVPIVAAANTHYQQSMAMSHVSLDRAISSSQGTTQLPYSRIPTGPPPVFYDVPETSVQTVKKRRKRADALQVDALNRTYDRTPFPSAEERELLAKYLNMSPQRVKNWFAHAFVYTHV